MTDYVLGLADKLFVTIMINETVGVKNNNSCFKPSFKLTQWGTSAP